jgi:hypothetical protein
VLGAWDPLQPLSPSPTSPGKKLRTQGRYGLGPQAVLEQQQNLQRGLGQDAQGPLLQEGPSPGILLDPGLPGAFQPGTPWLPKGRQDANHLWGSHQVRGVGS